MTAPRITPARLRELAAELGRGVDGAPLEDSDDLVFDAAERGIYAAALAMAADELELARNFRLIRYRGAALSGMLATGTYGSAIEDGPSCAARAESYAHAMLAAERVS